MTINICQMSLPYIITNNKKRNKEKIQLNGLRYDVP